MIIKNGDAAYKAMTKIWTFLIVFSLYGLTTGYALAEAIKFQSDSTTALPKLETYFAASDQAITQQANPVDVLFQLKDDRRSVMNDLYQHGYFDAYVEIFLNNVSIDNILVVDAPKQIKSVRVSAKHGKRYQYQTVSITPIGPKLAARPAPNGDANLLDIQSYVSDIIDEWQEIGYLQTDIAKQDLVADHSNQTLTVNVQLDLGAKSVFNELDIATPTAVNTKKIRKIVGLRASNPIDAGTIKTIETRLRSTGTFSSVLIEPISAGTNGETDLKLSVTNKKTKRIEATIALSSLEGGSVSVGWTHRNFTGNADQLQVNGALNRIGMSNIPEWSLGASYRQPAIFSDPRANLATEFTLGERIYGTDRFRHSAFFLGSDLKKNDQTELGLGINLKRSQNISQPNAPLVSSISTPFRIHYDTRIDKLDPQSGLFSELVLTPFRQLDQRTNGFGLKYDMRKYHALNDRITVAGRLQLGQSFLDNTNAIIDPEFLYFSGGSNTVRGQPYQSLGSDIRGTDLSGAQGMAIVSAEIRFKVANSVTGVIFADYGYLTPFGWTKPRNGAQDHAGVGIGARYHTALGPIRFDLAHSPQTDFSIKSLALYFGLGQTF